MQHIERIRGKVARVRRRLATRPPGPGLPESLVWTVGLVLSQAVCALSVAAVVLWCFGEWPRDELAWGEALNRLLTPPYSIILVGCGALLPVVLGVPLVAARLGRDWRAKLKLQPPSVDLSVLAFGATLPLIVVSAGVHGWALTAWSNIASGGGSLAAMPVDSAMSVVRREFAGGPLWLLITTVALGPALIEEFVFRGLIGRGLTGRWGVPAGVLLTTILFAAAHLSPPHAVAVLPLGLFLHVAHLATQSLKAVIALHFTHNLFAAAAARWGLGSGLEVAPPLLWISSGVVLAISALLWQNREGRSEPRTEAIAGTALSGFTVLFVVAAV